LCMVISSGSGCPESGRAFERRRAESLNAGWVPGIGPRVRCPRRTWIRQGLRIPGSGRRQLRAGSVGQRRRRDGERQAVDGNARGARRDARRSASAVAAALHSGAGEEPRTGVRMPAALSSTVALIRSASEQSNQAYPDGRPAAPFSAIEVRFLPRVRPAPAACPRCILTHAPNRSDERRQRSNVGCSSPLGSGQGGRGATRLQRIIPRL